MKFNEPEHAENFLRSQPTALLSATSEYKPMRYLLTLQGCVRRLETNSFSNDYEKEQFLLQSKTLIQNAFRKLEFYAEYADKEKILKTERMISKFGILPILRAFLNAFMDIYNRQSRYWQHVEKLLYSRGVPTQQLCEDFLDRMGRHPTNVEMTHYMTALLNLNKAGIEDFELRYDFAALEEVKETSVHDFMLEVDLETLAEQGIKVYNDRMVGIDISHPKRIGICGTSGSGKSIAKLSLMEMYAKTHKVIQFNDINAEMSYTKQPSRRRAELFEFRKEPKRMDVETFTLPPFKLDADRREIERIDKFIQINPFLMRPHDWAALLDLSLNQQVAFSRIYWQLGEYDDISDLIKAVKASDIHSMTRNMIVARLENLIYQGVFGDKSNKDIENILMSDKVSSFDTSRIFDQALLRGFSTLMLSLIIEHSKRGRMKKPFLIAIEEFEYLLAEDYKNTRFEQYLNTIFRRLRVLGNSLIVVQQNIRDIPKKVIGNVSDWVVLRVRDSSQLKLLKESMGVDMSFYMDVIPSLENEHALYVNEKDIKVGRILPCCCHHRYPKGAKRG